MHFIDTDLTTHPPRGALIIAGDEDRRETGLAQSRNGIRSIRPHGIAQSDNTQRTPIARNADHRATLVLKRVDPGIKSREIDAMLSEKTRAPHMNLATADTCGDSLPGKRLEGFDIGRRCAARESRLDHGLGQRVFR